MHDTADLESLLDDSLAASSASHIPSDDFGDLDALLSASMAGRKQKDKIAATRKHLKRMNPDSADRVQVAADLAKMENELYWIPTAYTAVFDVQVCDTCGGWHEHFLGFFQEQTHKESKITRWIAANDWSCGSLPKKRKLNMGHSTHCCHCVTKLGWEN